MQNKNKKVLVVFGEQFPKKSEKWRQQFDEILGPRELERFVQSGNVQEAYELVNKLSRLTTRDGKRLSKLINWQGYELWWMHYDDICYNFCFPYIQYRKLLEYLKDFKEIYLYQAPYSNLFRYFLKSNDCRCVEVDDFSVRLRKWLIPGGIFVQLILSALFLLPLIIIRPKVMFWTNDKFNPPYRYDFRHKRIYQELEAGKVHFVRFIRGMESWSTVLRHAWQRKRPVIYSAAIIYFISEKFRRFEKKEDKELIDSIRSSGDNPEQGFWLSVFTHYLKDNIRVTRWSINTMKWLLQLIGVRSAILLSAGNRTFHEVLGCKLAGIKTVGVQHGLTPRYYFVADFMPEFDGEKPLSLDRYGLRSDWWKQYYLKYGRTFKPEQLYISGSTRPLEKEITFVESPASKEGPLKVLFVAEQLAEPTEIMPYLLALLEVKDFIVSVKFRPQTDKLEEWLKKNEQGLLGKINSLKGDIHQAISESDVVVGSNSTAVLEGLCQLKPFVFFWTNKWGDYFDIATFDTQGRFFVRNPADLIDRIRKSSDVPKEDLKKLQERFLGNPYQNGAKWLVEQAVEFSKNYGRQR